MPRPPLVLSAHPSAWNADTAEDGRRQATADGGSLCAFCDQPTRGWSETFHLNDNHLDQGQTNLAVSCPLCHLAQHLNRPDIEREAVLIWLPEMAQAAISALVRRIHLSCHACGLATAFADLPGSSHNAAAGRPRAAYRALHERVDAAALRLGTSSPRELGAALLDLRADDIQKRAGLLGGLRLLPLGRLFRSGRDIYPEILRSWLVQAGTPVITKGSTP